MPFKCHDMTKFVNSSQESFFSDKEVCCMGRSGWPKTGFSKMHDGEDSDDLLSQMGEIKRFNVNDDDDDSCKKFCNKTLSKRNCSNQKKKCQIKDINEDFTNFCGDEKINRMKASLPVMTMEDVKQKCREIDSLNHALKMGSDFGDVEDKRVEKADKSLDCDGLCPECINVCPNYDDIHGDVVTGDQGVADLRPEEVQAHTDLKTSQLKNLQSQPRDLGEEVGDICKNVIGGTLGLPLGILSYLCRGLQSFVHLFSCLISISPNECPCRNDKKDSSHPLRRPLEKLETKKNGSVEFKKIESTSCPRGSAYFDDTDAFSFLIEWIWSFICRLFSGICSKKSSALKNASYEKKNSKETEPNNIEQDHKAIEIKRKQTISLDIQAEVLPPLKKGTNIVEKENILSATSNVKIPLKPEEKKSTKSKDKMIKEESIGAILEPLVEKDQHVPKTKIPPLEALDYITETSKNKHYTPSTEKYTRENLASKMISKKESRRRTSKESSTDQISLEATASKTASEGQLTSNKRRSQAPVQTYPLSTVIQTSSEVISKGLKKEVTPDLETSDKEVLPVSPTVSEGLKNSPKEQFRDQERATPDPSATKRASAGVTGTSAVVETHPPPTSNIMVVKPVRSNNKQVGISSLVLSQGLEKIEDDETSVISKQEETAQLNSPIYQHVDNETMTLGGDSLSSPQQLRFVKSAHKEQSHPN